MKVLCVKMIYTLFCKFFVLFYTVNLYILCIHDFFLILHSVTHLWIYGMYVRMYVMYLCMYVCT